MVKRCHILRRGGRDGGDGKKGTGKKRVSEEAREGVY